MEKNIKGQFLDLVRSRYSCRSYQPASVEQEKLDYIMECVRLAPSACNKQPWKFRVISSEEDRKKLCQCYNREWFATAPVCIIASVLHDEEWVRADGKHHGDIDIAIAVEHLCLNEEAAVLIPLGYPADEPKEKKRKSMEEIAG